MSTRVYGNVTKKKLPRQRFAAVQFLSMLPRREVADHEVFMEFNGDSDALAFCEWWDLEGSFAFAEWLEMVKKKRTKE